MGAKQSKRSVDISGKEAEGVGEVAAAGAGGEGRLEAIADIDNLKPQLNGDTPHITPPEEQTDKEKQLDSGTPENEKDATTEKENKDQESDKEAAPVTNGESETKADNDKENGEATPETEVKKPKKEKVKKKWSLRSISFSRKDKPKQEKKNKEEEPKTNGEPEKVPEEAAEAVAEIVENAAADNEKSEASSKEEKTPEAAASPAVVAAREEPVSNGAAEPSGDPDHLPVQGLSISDPAPPEAQPEPVTAPEIPVKAEVCVEQVPLVESTPPPLPANPPPSSVASFAATTMAPELVAAPPSPPADELAPAGTAPVDTICEPNDITETVLVNNVESQSSLVNGNIEPEITPNVECELPPPVFDESDAIDTVEVPPPPPEEPEMIAIVERVSTIDTAPVLEEAPIIKPAPVLEEAPIVDPAPVLEETPIVDTAPIVEEAPIVDPAPVLEAPIVDPSTVIEETPIVEPAPILDEAPVVEPAPVVERAPIVENVLSEPEPEQTASPAVPEVAEIKDEPITEPIDEMKNSTEVISQKTNGDLIDTSTAEQNESVNDNILTKNSVNLEQKVNKEVNGVNVEEVKMNGAEQSPEEETTTSLGLCRGDALAQQVAQPVAAIIEQALRAAGGHTQDPLPVHDKIADLIPEVPDLPTETTTLPATGSDVAVAN